MLKLLALTALLALILSQIPLRVSAAYQFDDGVQDFRLQLGLGGLPVYRIHVPGIRLQEEVRPLSRVYGRFRLFAGRYAGLSWYLSRRARWSECRLRVELGTADAARTGLLVGYTWAVAGLLLPFVSRYADLSRIRPRIEVKPLFRQQSLRVHFTTTFELKTGYLAMAVFQHYRRSGRKGVLSSATGLDGEGKSSPA